MLFSMPEEINPFVDVARNLHQKWLDLSQAKFDFDEAVNKIKDCVKNITINQRVSPEVLLATNMPRNEFVRLLKKDMLSQIAEKLEKDGFIKFREFGLPDNKGLEYEMTLYACKNDFL